MPRRIVPDGATGYTGRLVAEALVARALSPVLVPRVRERFEALEDDCREAGLARA
ncbi:MAG TPA: hypothetical protein VE528_01250 [Thermoleophilaceae bacterium]|nr:hypothetical protein [Thermoleophilaceae bacterium]